uniref:Uncharacterized protein MANES_10G132200 n=1 Tax=Rhizophora mucronata TaxID=61149 RepID=A0A2P2KT48_RHIMU
MKQIIGEGSVKTFSFGSNMLSVGNLKQIRTLTEQCNQTHVLDSADQSPYVGFNKISLSLSCVLLHHSYEDGYSISLLIVTSCFYILSLTIAHIVCCSLALLILTQKILNLIKNYIVGKFSLFEETFLIQCTQSIRNIVDFELN